MFIDLANIDFAPGQGGGGQKPEVTFDVNPTTSDQNVTPPSGSVFSGGVVRGVDSSIDSNITSGNIKDGVTILGVTGDYTGSGIVPSGTINLSMNGTFNVSAYEYAEVDVSGAPTDYRYKKGTIPGLSDLGWDTDDIGYLEWNIPHYDWQDGDYTVSQANKALYGVVDDTNYGQYASDTDMVYLPKFDTSSVTDFADYFIGFENVKAFPVIDISGQTTDSLSEMFDTCRSMVIAPMIDMTGITNLYRFLAGCESLKSVPDYDTSSVTNFGSMFAQCYDLEEIPNFDTGSGVDFNDMFSNCSGLKRIPALDLSNAERCESMFQNCQSLEEIPQMDFSNIQYFSYMFAGVGNLKLPSTIDLSSALTVTGMFSSSSVKKVPALDTSNILDSYMNDMFAYNPNLTTIEGIDFSSLGGYPSNFFYGSYNLNHIIVNGKIDFSWPENVGGFDVTSRLDFASIKSILQAMYRTTNNYQKTMAFNSNQYVYDPNNEISQLITDCGTKGWTVTGLTVVHSAVAVNYTTDTGEMLYPYSADPDVFGQGVALIGNVYENGVGTWYFNTSPTKFGDYAFYNYDGLGAPVLTSVYNIPSTVTEFGNYCLYEQGLSSFTIPGATTSMGDDCLAGFKGTSITIPATVTYIGGYALWGTNTINEIIVNATVPPSLGGPLCYEHQGLSIKVPAGSVSDYQNATWWSSLSQYIVSQ